ncbi:uncharacterized protein LOC141614489 [Silene latifolia]|uniref:uncharacterized protein LOC141614489 n=1 Tax=Silene latifolia TaxID=37657 RepID=UPI003D773EEF
MGKEKATVQAAAAAEAEELPRTIVRRVVKDKLSELSGDSGDVMLHKEALLAFSESARIFIHYLSATAHDICSESKRQIINAEDVLNALDEIEFSEFVGPLREALDEFRKKAAGKRAGTSKAKDDSKKRKTDGDTTSEKGGDEVEENNVENEDEVEEQANGDSAHSGDEVEEQASGDNGDEVEEQVSGDNEDEVEEQASGDDEDEVEEQASGDDDDDVKEQASGDDEDEVEEHDSDS